MPAYTSPDNIQYPVSTDQVAPLETVFANMAQSTQNAFDGFRIDWNDFETNRAIQTFRWADATERAAQTGMVAGDVGYQVDTGLLYRYTGSKWNVASPVSGIIPSGATGGTVSAATGVVTFVSQTSVSVDSVMTSDYPFYDIELVHTGPSGTPSITLLLRSGGVNQTSGYDRLNMYGQSGAAGSVNNVNQANWAITAAERNVARITLINAATSAPTQMRGEVFATPAIGSSAGMAVFLLGGQHRNSTACDGFRFDFSVASSGFLTIKGHY